MKDVGVVIVAAGSSARMAGVDKIWSEVGGRPILWYSLARLAPHVHHCVVVTRPERFEDTQRLAGPFETVSVTLGGASRHDSVRSGLDALGEVDVVAVHDAARPFAPTALLRRGLWTLEGCDAAVPGLHVPDTIKEVDTEGIVARTPDRQALRAVQTPQVFRREALEEVHRRWSATEMPTDDAVMLERAGYRVRVFEGDPDAMKVTTSRDLLLARLLFDAGAFE